MIRASLSGVILVEGDTTLRCPSALRYAGCCRSTCRSRYASFFLFADAIGSLGDIGTSRHQRVERLGVFQKKPVVDHAGVVLFKRLRTIACGHKPHAVDTAE
jgi:hypothetical protein